MFSLALSEKNVVNFVPKPIVETPQVIELRDLLKLAEQKGLRGQVKTIKKRILAAVLEQNSMALLEQVNCWDGDYTLYQFMSSGEVTRLGGSNPYFRRVELEKYEGNIPLDILKKIPDSRYNKTYIFATDIDPIIAVKIRGRYYIGILQWE